VLIVQNKNSEIHIRRKCGNTNELSTHIASYCLLKSTGTNVTGTGSTWLWLV